MALARADGTGTYVDVTSLNEADEQALAAWLADEAVPKLAYDVKRSLHAMRHRGWTLGGLATDTQLAAYLVRPGQRSFALDDLVLRYLKRELRVEQQPEERQLSLLDGEEGDDGEGRRGRDRARPRHRRAGRRAGRPRWTNTGSASLLAEIELPLLRVLAELEAVGIAVDTEQLASLEAHFAARVKHAEQEAFSVIGKEINLGSPKQLQVVLFDELQMPKTKRTKTGYTTDADALTGLFEQTEHPFLRTCWSTGTRRRLKITVEGLIKSVADDGRIHTTYSQTIAATGRLSSTEPNLQNVPDPHRRGPHDPRHVHRRRRLRRADDRGLQPDRDADHGAPVRRRGADRGVPVRLRLPRRHRRAGVLGRADRGHAAASAPRSRR